MKDDPTDSLIAVALEIAKERDELEQRLCVAVLSGDSRTAKKLARQLLGSDSRDQFISLSEAAGMLGLDPSTIRKRQAGTEGLALIRQGRKLFLIRDEVLAHRARLRVAAQRRADVLELIKPK